ncbi:MAG: nitroreductase family protein [Bacteroidales bacterium]|nr:nitroreductase family protein [Bacteroidales bacterium]
MKFQELILQRQSVRRYQDKAVEPEKLEQCIEAARLAPSASNSQPWTFLVVNEAETLKNLAPLTSGPLKSFNQFVAQVPVVVLMILEKPKLITEIGGRLKKKEFPLIDIGLASGQFCLQATELGLGTCMLGWFDEAALKKLLHIPKDKTIGLLITLGYAPDDYRLRKKTRKKLEEVVKFNKYH